MSHPVRHRTKGELLRDLEDAQRPLWCWHVQIPDLDHTDTILEELKGVFEDNDNPSRQGECASRFAT
jgi:hypothetical protein